MGRRNALRRQSQFLGAVREQGFIAHQMVQHAGQETLRGGSRAQVLKVYACQHHEPTYSLAVAGQKGQCLDGDGFRLVIRDRPHAAAPPGNCHDFASNTADSTNSLNAWLHN